MTRERELAYRDSPRTGVEQCVHHLSSWRNRHFAECAVDMDVVVDNIENHRPQ